MTTDYPSASTIIVYQCSHGEWCFAEVDPAACIYRFGPFDSEKAIHEILSVIYPDDPHRLTIEAPADYDDATILRTATRAGAAPPGSPCPTVQGGSGTSTSWWKLFFSRHAPALAPLRVLGSNSKNPSGRGTLTL
ncbi:hypothetical protein [Cupriavidus sp. RAF12]|uniref:hypothetical protein n=1 Tax=Cupriavidus sp. RAF12 TaxID=3233050 RepID=UPI003F93F4D5